MFRLCLRLVLVTFLVCAIGFGQGGARLVQSDVALLREVAHLQSALGPLLWPDWTNQKAPFLYKTRTTDFLFNHPHPPGEFRPTYNPLGQDSIWLRPNTDSLEYQATFPINGIPTVVITSPDTAYDPCLWVLKATHELFHVYQGTNRIVNPFVGPYADKHELSFPFDYSSESTLASCRVEAELLFNFLSKKQLDGVDSSASTRVLRDALVVQKSIFRDSLHFRYKQWMEWKEGVARYTERRLADLARDTKGYQPDKDFVALFPGYSYPEVWDKYYEAMLNPVRFVGEGVRGRGMFYYSGMGKAYILDRIHAGWRSDYCKHTLDDLLTR
jgi:hypothetical protein